MSVRKCADHARAPANLADDPLEWIVGLHLAPVIARKREVRQRLVRLVSTNSAALVRRIALSFTITSRTLSSAERRSLPGAEGLQLSSDVGELALRHISSVSVN